MRRSDFRYDNLVSSGWSLGNHGPMSLKTWVILGILEILSDWKMIYRKLFHILFWRIYLSTMLSSLTFIRDHVFPTSLSVSHVASKMDVTRVHQRRFIHSVYRCLVVWCHTLGAVYNRRLSLSRDVQCTSPGES